MCRFSDFSTCSVLGCFILFTLVIIPESKWTNEWIFPTSIKVKFYDSKQNIFLPLEIGAKGHENGKIFDCFLLEIHQENESVLPAVQS